MRFKIAHSLVVICVVILAGDMELAAQTGRRIVADVPFDFFAGEQRMLAGKYEFFESDRTSQPAPVAIRTIGGKAVRSAVLLTTPEDGAKYGTHPVLVFTQYDGDHFLSGVHNKSAGIGLRLLRSPNERLLAKKKRPVRTIIVSAVPGVRGS